MAVRVIAPAKVNLTLEVLGRRPDGYHEIASIAQTVSLADRLSLDTADALTLEVTGPQAAALAATPADNLVLRAARVLAREADLDGGASIQLEKVVPVAMGFGGGSSDAAAVLRGLNELWQAQASLADLAEIGGSLGADVPFFLQGGTRLLSGRGSLVDRLPDHPPTPLVLLATADEIADKTRRMYAALTADQLPDGGATAAARRQIEAGGALLPAQLVNAFDAVAPQLSATTGQALALCREAGLAIHVAGAGPGLFVYGVDRLEDGLNRALAALGVVAYPVETLARDAATRLETL